MRIVIDTIDHQEQRMETCGDYWFSGMHDDPEITIRVSRLGDWRKEFLVAVHEAVEAALCFERGIPEPEITAFDQAFEDARAQAGDAAAFYFRGRPYPIEYEPGDARPAPYQNEHNFATAVERMVCAAFAIPWADYEDAVEALPAWEAKSERKSRLS